MELNIRKTHSMYRKTKVIGFQKEMEEISREQKNFAVPDPDLREKVRRDNKDFVLPHYRTFYKKYWKLPFTKNPKNT